MRRDTQAVLLLLIGGTLLKISLMGTYVRYVKPGALPLLLLAGGALLAVAAVTLWQAIRTPGPEVVDDGHGHGEPRVGWLLLLPALALLLFAPPAIGSFQASRSGTALGSQASSDFAPLPEGDPVRISVLDYASRAVFDQGRSLTGRHVMMSGFVIAGPDGEPYLARMMVQCCAADARPIKVGLTGDVPSDVGPDRWLEVVGTYTERSDRDAVNGQTIPYLQVLSSKVIPAPSQQYES